MLMTTFTCLFALACLAAAIVLVIQGPDPIRPIALVSLCCLSFVLGMVAQREIATWEARLRRYPDRSDSCQGE